MPLVVAVAAAVSKLRKLSWGGETDAAIRTTHEFSLGTQLDNLRKRVDPIIADMKKFSA